LMFGHPVMGAAAGVAKQYAPTVGAWALHKASRFAEMKALRAEVLVAMRRSARAAAVGGEAPRFAKVAIPNLPPHELRATAAQAMVAVAKTARGGDLSARLAALDPAMPILAPRASQATEGAARRAQTWLATKIPGRIQAAIAQGHEPSGRDLSDGEARDFLDGAAVTIDPRYATDALARGQLTPTLASGLKAVWPSLAAQTRATITRQQMTDRASFESLPSGKKSQIGLLGPMPTLNPAGMTMTLQHSAAAMIGATAAKAPAGGKSGGSSGGAGLSKLTDASLLQSQAQMLEGNAPGRRGRSKGAGL
jgi:hypothetical protein